MRGSRRGGRGELRGGSPRREPIGKQKPERFIDREVSIAGRRVKVSDIMVVGSLLSALTVGVVHEMGDEASGDTTTQVDTRTKDTGQKDRRRFAERRPIQPTTIEFEGNDVEEENDHEEEDFEVAKGLTKDFRRAGISAEQWYEIPAEGSYYSRPTTDQILTSSLNSSADLNNAYYDALDKMKMDVNEDSVHVYLPGTDYDVYFEMRPVDEGNNVELYAYSSDGSFDGQIATFMYAGFFADDMQDAVRRRVQLSLIGHLKNELGTATRYQ